MESKKLEDNRAGSRGSGRQRIAVVGAGVAGLTTAYLFDQGQHEVTLYEKNDYLGGHTNTQVIPFGPDRGTAIDTGFIVLNDQTYPCLHRLLNRLDIPVEETEMSFSYWNPNRNFGFAGTSLNGLFAQRKNLLKPSFYRLLFEIRRFASESLEALESGTLSGMTLRNYLEPNGFSLSLQEDFLLPMGAAIWSTSTENILDYPAEALVSFFRNHGLLSLKNRPQWQTLPGRGKAYVENFKSGFRGRIHTNSKIEAILERENRAVLRLKDGSEAEFDYVVMACHADQALNLLGDPTDLQQELLSPWEYQENLAYLHWDESAMPPNRRNWAAWNFIAPKEKLGEGSVFVTYYMNRLQNLTTERDYFVTLNPRTDLDPTKIIYHTRYSHPLYTLESLNTQAMLPDLNLNCRILFCGSYFGHGFHEDAVKSGAAVASLFGLDL